MLFKVLLYGTKDKKEKTSSTRIHTRTDYNKNMNGYW